ncbi:hypothetical protein N9W47_03320 [Alphaproteobacteria bacterium]|nr:hypothetical protein [Alphaproteobacteria bacterium]
MNNHHNDNTPVYLVETHIKLERAIVSFCERVVFFYPSFDARAALVDNIVDLMNKGHKSSYITNKIAVLYYDAEWVEDKMQFEITVRYIGFETDVDFLERAN